MARIIKMSAELMALQLPEGYTARKIGDSIKVVVARKKAKKMAEQEAAAKRIEKALATGEAELAAYHAKKASEKAGQESQMDNPPALEGRSEKQVAWASKIRAAFIAFYRSERPRMVIREITEHVEARYWIDHRDGMGVTNADQRAINAMYYKK